eukprot:SAG31_NODE_21665_length_543_cov_410.846847_1_plen_105_part_10
MVPKFGGKKRGEKKKKRNDAELQLANGFETLTTKYFGDVNALYQAIGYVPPWDRQLSKLKLENQELKTRVEELESQLKRESVGKKETIETAIAPSPPPPPPPPPP